MINYSAKQMAKNFGRIFPVALLLLIPLLYLATMARTPVVGDPTEYTFVAYVLGVAHPPGYALMTLITKSYQLLIPIGSIAWRSHLVAVTAGTLAALCVAGTVAALRPAISHPNLAAQSKKVGSTALSAHKVTAWSAVFAALIVAFAVDHWQHSIHANPHIITATFLAFNLFALTAWFVAYRQGKSANKWLYAFCISAGLGVTHHPLTVFALPACVVFVLVVYPRILLDWKTLLKGSAFVLLGLLPWLYFPLRAPALEGTQFVSNMNSVDGFLDLVLARGLRVNLFAFGLSDQWDRLTVFWTLLRLQHALPVIFLALIGIAWLATTSAEKGSQQYLRPLLLLYLGAFLLNYLFVMNTVQDVMAYLLGPFLIVGLLAGIGMLGLIDGLQNTRLRLGRRELGLLLALLFVMGPGFQLLRTLPFVSLRNYAEGVDYVAAVHDQFDHSAENAALLNDWEHMTPLWYEMLVEERGFDSADVTPKFVSAALPWVQGVFDNLPAGPVYLSRFERSVFDAGFRLRPRGDMWQVVEPGDQQLPADFSTISAQGGPVEIVGYRLPERVQAGQLVDFELAMRVSEVTGDIYMPVLKVGDATLGFTTDSHLLTPQWQADEIIVERFEFVTPANWPAQDAQVTLELHDLTGGSGDTGLRLDLGQLAISANNAPARSDQLLANFRQRAGLADAWVRNGLFERRRGIYAEPIVATAGDTIHITLQWEVLAKPEDSYTVFVHLIDAENRPIIDNLDYTPLGGATPSHLWFAKWLPGQKMLDPYQMQLDGVPPGEYFIEVGLYEQFTKRRLHNYDAAGNIDGDRIILGKLIVQ